MTVNRDRLLVDLDALTEEQIEAGLAAGVWGDEARPTVQHYLLKLRLAAEHEDIPRSTNEAARVAVQEATTAKLRATAALIVAVGAMAAAMASAFVAFLALRHWT